MTDGRGGGDLFPWGLTPGGSKEPDDAEAPGVDVDPPTEAMPVPPDIDDETEPDPDLGPPTEAMAMPVDPDLGPPTEAMPAAAPERVIPAPVSAAKATSGDGTELIPIPGADDDHIDSVFGSDKFTDHSDEPIFAARSTMPGIPRTARSQREQREPREPREPRTGFSRGQRIALWSAGVLLAILALAALYFAGTRLATVIEPAAAPTPTPTETAEPEPTSTVGPVTPGEYAWDELLGGECIDPFVSPWEENFTVVDCGDPHAAQLLGSGDFPDESDESGDTYPGVDALQAQINLLCTAPTLIDYDSVAQLDDLVVAASFAAIEEEWADGYRSFSCFASRSSGDPITGSIAIAPTPAP